MNVSVKRVERYLAARKKLRQLEQAWIHWINEGEESEAELRTEDITSLLEQRTQLLEALKLADRKIVKMYDGITCGCGEDYAKIDSDSIAIREAITKAEEAE